MCLLATRPMMAMVLFGFFFRVFFRPRFSMPFWSLQASILEPFWVHFGYFFDQKSIKNASRRKTRDFHENLLKQCFFNNFQGPRGSQLQLFRSQIDVKIDLVFGRRKSRPRDRTSHNFEPRRPEKTLKFIGFNRFP